MKTWLVRFVSAIAVILSPPLAAAPEDADLAAGLQATIDEDAHIATLAYRLTTNAGALCPDQAYQLGLVLQSRDQYAPWLRPAAERQFGLDDHVAVSAVVAEGPAARAGLRVGDRLLSVDGAMLPRAPLPSDGSYATVAAALAAIDDHLADGRIRFGIERDGHSDEIRVEGTPGCAVRVQLLPSPSLNSFADDRYATMTTALARFASNDDELAVFLGHEVAHAILHHQALLDRRAPARRTLGSFATPAALILRTERDADRIGLYLAARAGFDIAGAQGLWERLAAAYGPSFTILKTHPAAREREAMLATTAQEILRKQAAGEPLLP